MGKDKGAPNDGDSEDVKSAQIRFLEHKQRSLFQIMQEVYNLSLKVADPACRSLFLARTQSIERTRSDFTQTLDNLTLEYMKDDPKVQPSFSVLSSFDTLYCYIKQTEATLKQQSQDKRKENDLPNIKLPPLKLASFDGTPSKWPSLS